MPYTIIADPPKSGASVTTEERHAAAKAVERAVELMGRGYKVLITDMHEEIFAPDRFKELLRDHRAERIWNAGDQGRMRYPLSAGANPDWSESSDDQRSSEVPVVVGARRSGAVRRTRGRTRRSDGPGSRAPGPRS